ncbi:MAG: aldo/keto reductase [Planctomycetes bacterium]|nr:aldo/keto reductase [Planctomycetota bacterium]
MEKITLGKTGLEVTRTAFGALPVQRVDFETAAKILRRAYEAGINFFDTANAYSDSEEKIGLALSDVRENIVIATKSGAGDRDSVLAHIELSLKRLKTDYIDIVQLHNPKELPNPDKADSSYAGLVRAKEQGMIRHIGLTNHSIDNAKTAVASGLYETMQFPLSAISAPKDLELIEICAEANVGLIAMKALCGGLLADARMAFAFLRQYENVVPIWGVQRMEELEEFIALDANPPVVDDDMLEKIEKYRNELGKSFCRACGYCLPCPADIPIPMAARMKFLLRRAPTAGFLEPDWQEKMKRINNCIHCNACASRCPYGIDTPALLAEMLEDYEEVLARGGV